MNYNLRISKISKSAELLQGTKDKKDGVYYTEK